MSGSESGPGTVHGLRFRLKLHQVLREAASLSGEPEAARPQGGDDIADGFRALPLWVWADDVERTHAHKAQCLSHVTQDSYPTCPALGG